MREDLPVECPEHGSRTSTFMCQHLVSGTGAGFHWGTDDDDPDWLWPDAWCDACERAREAEGGWHSDSETLKAIRLVCDVCYEVVRERNWTQDNDAYHALVADAVAYLQAQQDELSARYALGQYSRYDWDQETGQLVFSHDGRSQIVADIHFVGSVSTVSRTWLWAWANGSLVEPAKAQARQIRAYGETHRYLRLASARWTAEEADGWEMAAVAAYLLKAKGAYRSPGDGSFTFMVLTDIGWAQ